MNLKCLLILVNFFACLATTDLVKLGYNPSMKPILWKGEIVTEIIIGGEEYVTTGRVLSDFWAKQVPGQGTHVLVVQKKNNSNAAEMALKFYWVPETDLLEGEMLTVIRDAALAKGMNPDLFLLNIDKHGKFILKKSNSGHNIIDSLREFIRAAPPPPKMHLICKTGNDKYESSSSPIPKNSIEQLSVGGVPGLCSAILTENEALTGETNKAGWKRYKFHFIQCHQVFLLFPEVGIVLHDIVHLPHVFLALHEAIKGMLQCELFVFIPTN